MRTFVRASSSPSTSATTTGPWAISPAFEALLLRMNGKPLPVDKIGSPFTPMDPGLVDDVTRAVERVAPG